MTLQQLRCFASVAKTRNFAQAAQELYISQPAVTHHIQTLEAELGVKLLDRDRKHVALTPAGSGFFAETSVIFDRLEEAVRHARQSSGYARTLMIGWHSSVQVYRLAEIYRRFHELYPHTLISVRDILPTEHSSALLNGQVDLLFSVPLSLRSMTNLRYATLFRGWCSCIVPRGHRLSEQKRITAQDIGKELVILLDAEHCPREMDKLQQYLRSSCPEASFCYSGSAEHTFPMVASGMGIAFMPSFVGNGRAEIDSIPFDYQEPDSFEYGIAWRADSEQPELNALIAIAREVYEQTDKD